MLGQQERRQLEFFVCGSLRDLLPDDHVLARVDRVLDLSWLPAEVGALYAPGVGRPGIAPEAAVRLMLAGFLLGIVHDRRLLREAQVNLAIRWFAGYGLQERLPDHSSLTRIRQRWGAERFRRIFERTVKACIAAGIAKGEIVHVDASLIRADVAWESLARRHVDAVAEANADGIASAQEDLRRSKKSGKFKKVCLTDPDATMATTARNRRLEPSYKQHGVVDERLHHRVVDRGRGAQASPPGVTTSFRPPRFVTGIGTVLVCPDPLIELDPGLRRAETAPGVAEASGGRS
jgi:transposase